MKTETLNGESILCVFSGGSTTCNFIQFSFLLFVEMRTATASATTCSSNNKRNQWIFYLFECTCCVSFACDWNKFIHLGTIPIVPSARENRIDNKTVTLPHVNMCTICSAGSREHKKPVWILQPINKVIFCVFAKKMKRLYKMCTQLAAAPLRDPFKNDHQFVVVYAECRQRHTIARTPSQEPGSLRIQYLLS